MPARIAVVGGGITGLAAAYHLERLTDAEIDLYEASTVLGGKLRTQQIGEFLVEEGPDCFFLRKANVMELVSELRLKPELIQPLQKQFLMLIRGELHAVPSGLATFNFTNPDAVEAADFLSISGKHRALDEPNQPVGTDSDESIQSFFRRRYGEEFSRLVAEPLLAGTHGGDAARLSMKALYPGYFELERRHGSLSAGINQLKPTLPGAPTFVSFRNGMQTLVQALEAALTRTKIHLRQPIASLDILGAEQILVCLPAAAAAKLVNHEAALLLGEIEHRSSAVVTLAFRAEDIDHPLDGTGFLVPATEATTITGATWSSRKWAGRAPDCTILMRVFQGGDPATLTLSSDTDLEAVAKGAIAPLLCIRGEPILATVSRWIEALPQYTLGHLDRIVQIEQAIAATPNIHLAGTSYGGVGIPDCLRQGRELAERIGRELN